MLDRIALIRRLARMGPAVLALLAACAGPPDPAPHAAPVPLATAALEPPAGSTGYVGRAACAGCHAMESAAWQGSHHDLAMQEAGADSVLGDFDGTRFDYAGITSTFSQRGGRYYVTTDGPDGSLAEFQIRYTFGHSPLQQYLIELPGGRLQAFGIAWDSRPAPSGGQRWFHLYPGQGLKAGDRLHWTGRDQNWNFMCAGCHSTGLEKHYDAATDSYATTWAEIDVSCEACHGPGQKHVRWAGQPDAAARAADPRKGLDVAFHERHGIAWMPDPARGIARRSAPRETRIEIDACGRCHARATELVGGAQHGAALLDSHRPALLDAGEYAPDGQMRAEVFNWAPFLASRMQAAGVTCSDCHQPHSLKLRAQGNALCAQCHEPARFDQPAHSHHVQDSSGSQCVACHMPTTTFMQVDARHDHGFRVPRPDLAGDAAGHDACTACHTDRQPAWAAATLAQWFPAGRQSEPSPFPTLAAAADGAPGIGRSLAALAAEPTQPAIIRASALRGVVGWPTPAGVASAIAALDDPDPLLRLAAVEASSVLDPQRRAQLLAARLEDPVRAVRIEAAAQLAGAPEAHLAQAARAPFVRALGEYQASLDYNADRPDVVVAAGDLAQARGDDAGAQAAYRRALKLEAGFAPAAVRLSELQRRAGDEAAARATLERALAAQPDEAALHHALGLARVREARVAEGVQELRKAAELAPDSARHAFVLAVALADGGDAQAAREVLDAALLRHPYDRDLLQTAALYTAQAGRIDAARVLAARLLAVDPEDAAARQLVAWLASQGADR